MIRLFLLTAWLGMTATAVAGDKQVTLRKTPGNGIQPQVALDAKGTLHVLYFEGEAKGGDLLYVRREAGKLSQPLRVNSQAGSAIATGTIRGGHIAIGKDGRVHVAWNGSQNAEPKNPISGMPMMYARLNDSATAFLAPFADAVIHTPITFRQSATDADNHLNASIGAAYVQDQFELTRRIQVVTGIRIDRFELRYHNNRNSDDLRRRDLLVSPRAGLVFKPVSPLSLYANYSVSYLPSSGDQFSSLTMITQQVQPEKFNSYEVGAKWDVSRRFSVTTALYRLDRTNTRSTDPNDATRIVQTGSQRTNGYEFGANGNLTRRWSIAGGYAFQDAFVTSATTAAKAGAMVAQVPRHTLSLWNNYRILPKWGAGFGILNRSDMFAAIDNTVRLPAYTRVDAAMYYSLTERVRLQGNVENLFDRKYYVNADSNTNISPGFARAVRVGLIARF